VPGEEAKMIEFLSNTDVIALDENVASATISLKKKLKIKTPLKLFNPYEL
jgi:hypothetical protein